MTIPGIDLAIATWMAHHRNPIADGISAGAMWLGSRGPGMLLVAAVLLGVGLKVGKVRIIIVSYLAIGAAMLSVIVLKQLIWRPRPPADLAFVETVGSSMPSTAAAVTAAGSVVLARLITTARTRWILALLLMNLVVGLSVIYLGAHWFTDVVVGALWGALIGVGADYLARHWWAATATSPGIPYPGSSTDLREDSAIPSTFPHQSPTQRGEHAATKHQPGRRRR